MTNSTKAQSEKNIALLIVSSEGRLDKNDDQYMVEINGVIRNTLPVRVSNVEVSVFFVDRPDILTVSTMIPEIEPESEKNFTIFTETKVEPSRFTLQATNYFLGTENIETIFEFFWSYADDPILRVASISTLKNLSPNSYSELITRFINSELIHNESDLEVILIEDLILLSVIDDIDSVQATSAIINKARIYDRMEYRDTFSDMKSWVGGGGTIIELLDRAAKEDKSLIDIIEDTLYSRGYQSLPILIQKSSRKEPESSISEKVLDRFGYNTPELQIGPLLLAASLGNAEEQIVVEILSNWVEENPRLLIQAMESSTNQTRRLLANILESHAEITLPIVLETLTRKGIDIHENMSEKEIIGLLVSYHEQQQQKDMKNLYLQGLTHLSDGDCEKALEIFQKLKIMDYQYSEKDLTFAEAHICVSDFREALEILDQYLIENPKDRNAERLMFEALAGEAKNRGYDRGFDNTIRYWQEASTDYPYLGLNKQIGDLFFSKGKEEHQKKNWSDAISYFNQAAIYQEDTTLSKRELGKTLIRQKWKIVATGFLLLGIATWWIVNDQKIDDKSK